MNKSLPSEEDAQASLAPPTENRGFYSPQLDGLRFLAALLVFIHHAPALPWLGAIKTYGWVGVDLFLSISAFLITRLILLEYERTGAFHFRSFFIRRALRIWPLFLTYVTGASLLSALAGVTEPRQTLAWWVSHLSFTNNVLTAVKGYSPVPLTAHLWTISLEEQAYLLMPLLLSGFVLSGTVTRYAIQFCLGAIAVLMAARLALTLAGTPHPFIWVLPLRADAFLLGGLAAILTKGEHESSQPWLFAVGLVLICSVALFPSVEVASAYQVVGYTVIAAGCAIVVVASQKASLFAPLLGSGPARYLGKISYGIYVYHLAGIMIAVKLAQVIGIDSAFGIFLLGLALTLSIASLSYRGLERPFLLLKERYAIIQSRPV